MTDLTNDIEDDGHYTHHGLPPAGDADLSFPEALQALKHGRRIARAGWSGEGMFIYLKHGLAPTGHEGLIDGVFPDLFEQGAHDGSPVMPSIQMNTASGATVTGWLASQTDMLAEDWFVLGVPS